MAPFSISDAVLKVQAALRGGLLQKRIRLVRVNIRCVDGAPRKCMLSGTMHEYYGA